MEEYLQVVYSFRSPLSISSYLRMYNLSAVQNGMNKFPLSVGIFGVHMSHQSK